MSKKQKIMLIRIAIRCTIIAVLLVLIICQYKSIHNLKMQNKAISENVKAIESRLTEMQFDESEQIKLKATEQENIFAYIGEYKITGYDAKCKHCCGKADGITASMTEAMVGRTVAMNRTDMKKIGIEYGDTIYIDGIGERIVEDTGCGQGVIDVVVANHDDCYKITGNYNVFLRGDK